MLGRAKDPPGRFAVLAAATPLSPALAEEEVEEATVDGLVPSTSQRGAMSRLIPTIPLRKPKKGWRCRVLRSIAALLSSSLRRAIAALARFSLRAAAIRLRADSSPNTRCSTRRDRIVRAALRLA